MPAEILAAACSLQQQHTYRTIHLTTATLNCIATKFKSSNCLRLIVELKEAERFYEELPSQPGPPGPKHAKGDRLTASWYGRVAKRRVCVT